MGGGVHVRLAARKKGDARHGARHQALENAHGGDGHFLDAVLLGALLARHDHVGLEDDALQLHAGIEQLAEDRFQHPAGDALASCDVMGAVHQHFGFHDRHDAVFLGQRRIAGQRLGIGIDAIVGGNAIGDIDQRPPLGEARAQLVIFDETFAQPVQPFGDGLARAAGQGLGAGIDLDARHGTGLFDQLDQRRAVGRLLADGFVEQDHARDMLAHGLVAAEQKLAIGAAVVLGVGDADLVETLLDGAGGFIGGQDALAGRHHLAGDRVQLIEIHRHPLFADQIQGQEFGNLKTIWPTGRRRRAGSCLPAIPGTRRLRSRHR